MTEPTDTPTSPLATIALAVGLALYVVAVVWLLAILVPAVFILVETHLLPAVVVLAAQLPGQLATAPLWIQAIAGVCAVAVAAVLIWGGRARRPDAVNEPED